MNKFQWKIKRNSYIFIQENAIENVVCDIASILSGSQYVKGELSSYLYHCHWSSEYHGSTHFTLSASSQNNAQRCTTFNQFSRQHRVEVHTGLIIKGRGFLHPASLYPAQLMERDSIAAPKYSLDCYICSIVSFYSIVIMSGVYF